MIFKKKKTIFDHIEKGSLDDSAIAARMKVWLADKKPSVVKRALKLYDKLTPEKKSSFEQAGLSPKYVEKHRNRIS